MAFSRINYDKCTYDLKMNRSTQPGDYRLFDSSVENYNACLSYGGPIGSKADVSVAKLNNLSDLVLVHKGRIFYYNFPPLPRINIFQNTYIYWLRHSI